MTTGYSAGSVWWGLIDFGDGAGERKKYFVLLNDIFDENDSFIAAITTSRAARYHGQTSACGCPDLACYRIDKGQEKCFEFTTWVQYDNTRPVARAKLENMQTNRTGSFIQLLDADRIRAVLNCATKCRDLSLGDIERIKKTLNAFKPKSAATLAAKSLPPPSPVDRLRGELEGHEVTCRQDFCALLVLSETEVGQILSKSRPEPAGFIEDAKVAMKLIGESCECRAAGMKAT